jgi:ribosome maturation protein SDO1
MISLDRAVIARLTSHAHHFEIFVDPATSWDLREGDEVSVDDVVASHDVYKDASKAERVSEAALKEAFGTLDFNEIAKRIIRKGDIQLTTEQRNLMQKEKRKQIISTIAREAMDPRTQAPIPPARIEKAMDEAKIHVDPFKSAKRQTDEVLKKIVLILPIKMAKVRVEVRVSAQFAAKCYGYIRDFQRVREEWLQDGSLRVVLELPAGMQADLYDYLNKQTHGTVETKLLETI